MRHFAQRACLVIALLFCGVTQAHAQDTGSTPEQAVRAPAGKFIQDLGDNALGVLSDRSLDEYQRQSSYYQMLHSAFDLRTIARFVIGRTWNTATPEQKEEYMKLFEQLVVQIYGNRMNLYSGETFHVRSVRQESDQDYMVSSVIEHPNGSRPTLIDWRVRNTDGRFMIIDVVVDGVSQSVTQRQEYASIIERGGMPALLDAMRQRVESSPSTQPPPSSTITR